MCPACIESAAVMVAGAASTGGILAVCIGKFRKFLRSSAFGLFQKTREIHECLWLRCAVLREGTTTGKEPL
jgi:hypothetical protein